jgi:hypothetical protein
LDSLIEFFKELSINIAEDIPYKNFKDRVKIVNRELNKNRYVEIVDELKIVYSANKWSVKQ